MKNQKTVFFRLLLAGSLVFVCETFASNASAQYAASPATPATAPPESTNAPSPDTISGASGNSSKLNPKSGANNDPALQEPKAGPTGAPGVATESGSLDANGMHSNAKAPLPTP
jgi:hypothetical protein